MTEEPRFRTHEKTPEDARKDWDCPAARLFEGDVNKHCRGDDCPLWRWTLPRAADPRFTGAIDRMIGKLSEEQPKVDKRLLHKAAVEAVMANPRDHHVPDGPEVGYCGLGGKLEA